ncbi:uncharacterized protein KY384_008124 [Bacidia gigantensis]|uniref:uncharacterized protein n=1 Tax=Bacidia gigantensis TaxID=2732470 RepID=UPI001D053F49|nr:uncharacterized protein KY384_008124 [Bacidia gigantensis]KAG8526695.1 hypothetical protein KY384_008124 [Bacidia gigantensis]
MSRGLSVPDLHKLRSNLPSSDEVPQVELDATSATARPLETSEAVSATLKTQISEADTSTSVTDADKAKLTPEHRQQLLQCHIAHFRSRGGVDQASSHQQTQVVVAKNKRKRSNSTSNTRRREWLDTSEEHRAPRGSAKVKDQRCIIRIDKKACFGDLYETLPFSPLLTLSPLPAEIPFLKLMLADPRGGAYYDNRWYIDQYVPVPSITKFEAFPYHDHPEVWPQGSKYHDVLDNVREEDKESLVCIRFRSWAHITPHTPEHHGARDPFVRSVGEELNIKTTKRYITALCRPKKPFEISIYFVSKFPWNRLWWKNFFPLRVALAKRAERVHGPRLPDAKNEEGTGGTEELDTPLGYESDSALDEMELDRDEDGKIDT